MNASNPLSPCCVCSGRIEKKLLCQAHAALALGFDPERFLERWRAYPFDMPLIVLLRNEGFVDREQLMAWWTTSKGGAARDALNPIL